MTLVLSTPNMLPCVVTNNCFDSLRPLRPPLSLTAARSCARVRLLHLLAQNTLLILGAFMECIEAQL